MDSVELDHDAERFIGDTSAEVLLFPRSPDIDDIFGEPEILPRVGDQYQVEIQPLKEESDQLNNNPSDLEATLGTPYSLLMGLPIPVMWVYDQVDSIKLEGMEFHRDPKESVDTNCSAESGNKVRRINSDNKDTKLKVEPMDVELDNEKDGKHLEVDNHMDVYLPSLQNEKCNLDRQSIPKDFRPVPGSLGNSWSDIEQESFLLGLYIFGKNLVQVKRFIESKEMGDIQSYYYGRFYRSDGHRRWSECRKIRSRRCIHGQRIFTGSRQQELLSRVLPGVSEECKNSFLEVSKAFGEGKILLEDYVSNLKATVGIETLIEAVGIGKGKQDLTGIMDPVKTNQVIPVRQEIPSGKECNSLTSGDIVKFLTGDFRLSKARSNDLFWEAVWPRLLARGWHSEQPKNHGYVVNKNSLVFLIPSVKKFSRRRHVKGNHYFDSVSDVLNKVASDPTLLDVEVEAPRDNGSREDYVWGPEMKSDQDVTSDHQRHCYLRPRVSNCNSDLMKFTVVDTSLIHGEGPFKLRELRTLPVETNNTSTPSSVSGETVGESSDEPMEDEQDSANLLLDHKKETSTKRPKKGTSDRVSTELSDSLVGGSKQSMPINGSVSTNLLVENHKDQYTDLCNDKPVRKRSKCKLDQRVKPRQSNYLAPVKKRRRLTACGQVKRSRSPNNISMGSRSKEEEPSSHLDSPDARESIVPEVGPSQVKASTSSSTKVNPDDNSEGILCEKAEQRTLIDLNLPHVPPDFEAGEPFITEVGDSQDDASMKGSSFPSETIQPEDPLTLMRSSNGVSSAEEPPTVNARRQSTRNRPLTTKALEALAGGYLSTNRKPRDKKTISRENSFTRPSRRARGRANVATGVMDTKVDEGVDGECSSNTNMLSESRVQSEIKGAHELLGVSKPAYHSEVLAGKYNQPG
ncbi:SANT domain [Macleaya cordata]|uniref:SANT domain n=1 Tax=Macleaya cordata TaxID=56857 RepID=A0A200QX06_MACCD|nr:SANT domain [Macleaya cordata]